MLFCVANWLPRCSYCMVVMIGQEHVHIHCDSESHIEFLLLLSPRTIRGTSKMVVNTSAMTWTVDRWDSQPCGNQ